MGQVRAQGRAKQEGPRSTADKELNYRKGNRIIDLSFKGCCLQGNIGELCGLQMEISTARAYLLPLAT